jgi:hypothetical protein
MVAVVALKVAVVAPAATVTDPGTLNVLLVLVSVTSAPPAGADLLSVTVQVVDPFDPRLDGLHPSDDTVIVPVRLTVVLMAESPL